MDICNQMRPIVMKKTFKKDFFTTISNKYKYSIQIIIKYIYPDTTKTIHKNKKTKKIWRTRASIPLPLEIKKLMTTYANQALYHILIFIDKCFKIELDPLTYIFLGFPDPLIL